MGPIFLFTFGARTMHYCFFLPRVLYFRRCFSICSFGCVYLLAVSKLFDSDEILNKQRKVIYLERTGILNKESLQKNIQQQFLNDYKTFDIKVNEKLKNMGQNFTQDLIVSNYTTFAYEINKQKKA